MQPHLHSSSARERRTHEPARIKGAANAHPLQAIANEVGNEVAEDGYVPVICGLSRTKTADLDCAWDAVKGAARPRVHTFIATSQVHMDFKLRMSEDEVVAAAVAAVSHLVSRGCVDIEFSPEDAGRSERPFLYRILSEVIVAGATTLNIPDTTGWNLPHEFGSLIANLRANVEGAERVVFSTHCQNDLGLSTANSLAGAHRLHVDLSASVILQVGA